MACFGSFLLEILFFSLLCAFWLTCTGGLFDRLIAAISGLVMGMALRKEKNATGA